MKNRYLALHIGMFLFSVGILLSLYSLGRSALLATRSIKTEGVVVRLDRVPDQYLNIPTYDHLAIVSFFADGKEFQFEACRNCYGLQDRVPVIYDPSNPDIADIDSASLYVTPIYFLLGFSFFLWLFARAKKASNAQMSPPRP